MSREWRFRVEDILKAAGQIPGTMEALSREEFFQEGIVYDGLMRNLAVIGEAANHLPAELREMYPDVPWPQIIGFRHVIVHEYFRVDSGIAWDTITEELPRLVPVFEGMLKNHPD